MISSGVLPLLMMLAAGRGSGPDAVPMQMAQLTVRQRVIVRVPATAIAPAPAMTKWKEKKAPRCISVEGLAGAGLLKADRVDLILKGGRRIRIEFEASCTAVDFYSGFYIRPSPDSQLCAKRDSIHLRSGGDCPIKRFRLLVPDR